MQTAYFIVDRQYFKQRHKSKGWKEYQGWSNSTTWCYNLYFFQERVNYEAMTNLIRKDGTINIDRAQKLMWRAGVEIDYWCEGAVNVNEIVENFLRR